MICERCFNLITPDERHLRLAHMHQAHNDGSIDWVYAYVHAAPCGTVCAAPSQDVEEAPVERAA